MSRLALVILCALSIQLSAQLESISVDNEIFLVDNQNRLMVVDDQGLHQYDIEGNLLYHFSEDLLGSISSIDLTTAMRPFLFYSDIPAFQVLDNTLSPHGPLVSLESIGRQNVTTMCPSSNNGFWIYDAVEFNLVRLNEQLDIRSESGNLIPIIGKEFEIIGLYESSDRLFVHDYINGIHEFDFYGTYVRTIPDTKTVDNFHVNDGKIVFTREGLVHLMDINNLNLFDKQQPLTFPLDITKEQLKSVYLDNGRLFAGQSRFIQWWSLEKR